MTDKGKFLLALFLLGFLVMMVSPWFIINTGVENSRVDFIGQVDLDFLSMEGHHLVSFVPPYDFAVADSVLSVNIQFLEDNQLTSGPVATIGRQRDMSTYYRRLVDLRSRVNELASTYPDSVSGNHAGNEEIEEAVRPTMASIANFSSSFLLTHAMWHGLKYWSLAFVLSIFLFIYGLICFKQDRFV